MTLELLDAPLTVCRVRDIRDIALTAGLFFVSRTDEEISLVCETEHVPADTDGREDGWRVFRIAGELDFSLTGILSGIASVLAERKIPIFAVSTFNTDYVLVKEDDLGQAVRALAEAGYELRQA